jgi:hypothetical protein
MDAIKDYMNSFLGIIAIILPLLFIPELKKSKWYIIFCIVSGLILLWLGIDKISRDGKDRSINDKRRIADSITISKLNINVNSLAKTIKKNTESDSVFKKELRSKFKIVDSANMPVSIDNRHTNYTHISKADKVDIH